MERLNKEGLAYYHSLIKGFLTKVNFLRPTVKVRPGKPQSIVKREVYLTYNTEDYTGEVSLDPSDDAIAVQSWSDGLRFVIKCDSKAEAEALLDNGYSLRISFLSRKYGSPKWVCPSNLSDDDPEKNQSWIAKCPEWDQIPLTAENCQIESEGVIIVDISDVRQLMTSCNPDTLRTHVISSITNSSANEIGDPMLERAMLLGTDAYPIYNRAIFYHKKPIKLKGVLPYLQDTEQEITYDTVTSAPSNAYSFKVKVAVWYNHQELPGASTGCFVVTKKKAQAGNGNYIPVIQFKYKEEINNFK